MLGIAGLSMAGVFYKLSHTAVVTIVAYRMLFAALLIAPLALTARLSAGSGAKADFSAHDRAATIAAGVLFAIDLTLWASSLKYTTIASAALFVSMHPVFVAIFAGVFLKERPTAWTFAGIAIGLLGIVIVAGRDVRLSGHALLGDGLALCAALTESAYLLVGRHVRQRVNALAYGFVVYTACALCVSAAVLVLRAPLALSANDAVMALALAGVVTVGGHTLVSFALGHLPAAVVAVCFLAEPLFAALLALALLHQRIPAATALGGSIALCGIGLLAYGNERKRQPAAFAV